MSLPVVVKNLLKSGFLKGFDEKLIEQLFQDGMTLHFGAKTNVAHSEGNKIALVVSGLFRMTYNDVSGKTVTVRYIGPGEVMGIPVLVGGEMDLTVSVLTDAQVWVIAAQSFKKAAQSSPQLAWLVAEEVGRRLYSALSELIYTQCRSVRDRLCLHLREIAKKVSTQKKNIEIPVRQQDLAEGIGTYREVVARAIRELRAEGLLDSTTEKIIITDIEKLKISDTSVKSK